MDEQLQLFDPDNPPTEEDDPSDAIVRCGDHLTVVRQLIMDLAAYGTMCATYSQETGLTRVPPHQVVLAKRH